MLSTILVPLDSSPAAATALPVARALASALDARISLLRVVGRPGESFETHRSELREAESCLNRVARELASSGVRVSTNVRFGDVPGAILQEIVDLGADLVVMAAHGQTGKVDSAHDGTATEILSQSTVPVVLQRADGRTIRAIKKILVPIDRSAEGALALGSAVDLAHATGAHLAILEVVEPVPLWAYEASESSNFGRYIAPSWEMSALGGAERHVEGLVAQLREQGISASGSAVVGDVTRTIAGAAEHVAADLIVLGTPAYTNSTRAMLNSLGCAVARPAHSPVLVMQFIDRFATPARGLRHPAPSHSAGQSDWIRDIPRGRARLCLTT